MRRFLGLLLKCLVIGLLLWYVGRSIASRDLDFRRLEALRSGWGWMLLAQGLILITLGVSFYRFRLLLQAQGIRYSLREVFALGFIGFFFNQFIPGSTGGDVIKAYYVAVDHPERRTAGVTTVFLDRVVGVLALVVIAATAMALSWRSIAAEPALRFLAVLVAAIIVLCGAGGVLFFSQRFRSHRLVRSIFDRLPFRELLGNVQAAVYVYRFHPRLVLWTAVLSVVVQLSIVGMVAAYALALGRVEDLLSFFFIVPLGQLAMSVPIGLPGGLGQSELAYSGLFFLVGYPHGLLLALIQRANWCLWALWGCAHYFRRKGRVQRAQRLAGSEGEGGRRGSGTAEAPGEAEAGGPSWQPADR